MSYQTNKLEATDLEFFFREESLAIPYLPPKLKHHIETIQPGLFGTRSEGPTPYDLPFYIDELLEKNPADYIMIGCAGHGISSNCIHYFVVSDKLALFYQLMYGNVGFDPDEMKRRVDGFFYSINLLFEAIKEKDLKGDKLVIIDSDIHGHFWGLLSEGKTSWHEEQNQAFFEALTSLKSPM